MKRETEDLPTREKIRLKDERYWTRQGKWWDKHWESAYKVLKTCVGLTHEDALKKMQSKGFSTDLFNRMVDRKSRWTPDGIEVFYFYSNMNQWWKARGFFLLPNTKILVYLRNGFQSEEQINQYRRKDGVK
jgi:hypothetical protein